MKHNGCQSSFKIPPVYFAFKRLIFPIHFNGSSNVLPSTYAVQAYSAGPDNNRLYNNLVAFIPQLCCWGALHVYVGEGD
uniref:Uncharacterized protein n=1 Tax=Anguilla anguilla TaxID=7936 RepID=A0A0E9SIG9_ANGAN